VFSIESLKSSCVKPNVNPRQESQRASPTISLLRNVRAKRASLAFRRPIASDRCDSAEQTDTDNNVTERLATEDAVIASGTTTAARFHTTSSASCAAVIASFNPSSTGGGGSTSADATSSQTTLWKNSATSTFGGASYKIATSSGTITDTYTTATRTDWVMAAIALRPATSTSAGSGSSGTTLDANKFVIQGYALRWNTLIHVNHSEYAWVAPYAIRDLTRGVKRLHFDHNESRTIGTNSDGLILVADEFGIAMRFYPKNGIAIHREAVKTVRDNVRTALSVGIEFHNKQIEQYNGKPVRIVRDATISEISLVPDGACREAYCILIDKRECGPLLSDDVKSKRVLADGGYANVMRALRKLDAKLN